MALHILKLAVGADDIADMQNWLGSRQPGWPPGRSMHVTRMWPKREAEVLDGGSLYWVIKGVILLRQRILGLEEVDAGDGIRRCGLILDLPALRTEPAARRPFQGWRYLNPSEAPRDLATHGAREEALPPALALALAEMGVR